MAEKLFIEEIRNFFLQVISITKFASQDRLAVSGYTLSEGRLSFLFAIDTQLV